MADLLLRNVRLPDGVLADIAICDGKIARVGPGLEAAPGTDVLDGQGGMVSPGFVNAHIHPAQTFVGGPWVEYDYADSVPARAAAEAAYLARNGRLDGARACRIQFREAIRRGTTHVRGHIDVGSFGLEEMEEAAQAREDFRHVLGIDYVAMPANGILNMKTDPLATIPAALRLGAESIGGADPCDRDHDPVRSVELTARLAAEHGARIDLHLHEFGEMGLFSLRLLLEKVREYGLRDRVTISHAWCLAGLPDAVYAPLAAEFREWGVGIVTHVPGHVPFPSLRQARRLGVAYGVGTDNMRNLWSPYGMNDMRERVMLLAYLSDFRRRADLDLAWEAGTCGSASVLGLENYGLDAGCWADLVVFPVELRARALLEGPLPSLVIRRGLLVARDGILTDAVPGGA